MESATSELRIYIAPGEGADMAEALGRDLDVIEVEHLSLVEPGDAPAVLLLSAGLAEAGGGSALQALPSHVVVLAVDARGRQLAESTNRLFLAAEHLAGEDGLWRGLRAAAVHARACLALGRHRGETGHRSGGSHPE